jgi:hypothetical protein
MQSVLLPGSLEVLQRKAYQRFLQVLLKNLDSEPVMGITVSHREKISSKNTLLMEKIDNAIYNSTPTRKSPAPTSIIFSRTNRRYSPKCKWWAVERGKA